MKLNIKREFNKSKNRTCDYHSIMKIEILPSFRKNYRTHKSIGHSIFHRKSKINYLRAIPPRPSILARMKRGGIIAFHLPRMGILEEARGRPIYFWPTIRYLVSEIAARGMHRGCLHANDLRGADVEGAIPRMNQVTNAMQKPALMLPANCTPLNFPNVPLRPSLRNRSMRLRVSWTGDDRDGGWLECWDEKSHSLVLQQLSDLLFERIRKFWTKLQ